mgnify:CR=1 FL=1
MSGTCGFWQFYYLRLCTPLNFEAIPTNPGGGGGGGKNFSYQIFAYIIVNHVKGNYFLGKLGGGN